jgi:fumarate reductase flavoprotein subunit
VARSEDVRGKVLIFEHRTWEAAKDDAFSSSVKTPAPNPWLADHDGDIFSHETLEGLAKAVGVDAAGLSKTLQQYNHAIETKDLASLPISRTGKPKPLRAPFCGLKVVPGITFTMGGVSVNGRCEVLDKNEKVIPGLYAGGDSIGGLMGGYHGGYTGGLMQAIVTGILAGENAAA